MALDVVWMFPLAMFCRQIYVSVVNDVIFTGKRNELLTYKHTNNCSPGFKITQSLGR